MSTTWPSHTHTQFDECVISRLILRSGEVFSPRQRPTRPTTSYFSCHRQICNRPWRLSQREPSCQRGKRYSSTLRYHQPSRRICLVVSSNMRSRRFSRELASVAGLASPEAEVVHAVGAVPAGCAWRGVWALSFVQTISVCHAGKQNESVDCAEHRQATHEHVSKCRRASLRLVHFAIRIFAALSPVAASSTSPARGGGMGSR